MLSNNNKRAIYQLSWQEQDCVMVVLGEFNKGHFI